MNNDIKHETPQPELGSRCTITITDIAFGGEGVGRLGELVVFVPFVLVGEKVEVEITESKKKFARAKLINVLEASPDRVEPVCRYYGDCGGCQYQHMDYPVQLRMKHKQISDLFQRIGGIDPRIVGEVVPCPQPYGYRNRIMIRSQWDKFKQGLNIGFIRSDNRLVVDIEECAIAEPALNKDILHVRKNPPPKGGIKVVLRVPAKEWVVPKDSFFQNNFFLLPRLVETVRDCLVKGGSKYLVDVYCGVGFFGIELGDLVTGMVGVELDQLAIKAARQNAAAKGLTNAEFVVGRSEDMLPKLMERFPATETTVILDPPRTGCLPEIVELLRVVRPKQVIYVSCHPATMARDLNVFCSEGVFGLERVIPLDMFPQTAHVECVADLRLKTSVEKA
jgi:tRNA/tmRNA/rRNA uracil-C5-methylase (TrmA/RlmC/RlmD family)